MITGKYTFHKVGEIGCNQSHYNTVYKVYGLLRKSSNISLNIIVFQNTYEVFDYNLMGKTH